MWDHSNFTRKQKVVRRKETQRPYLFETKVNKLDWGQNFEIITQTVRFKHPIQFTDQLPGTATIVQFPCAMRDFTNTCSL